MLSRSKESRIARILFSGSQIRRRLASGIKISNRLLPAVSTPLRLLDGVVHRIQEMLEVNPVRR